MLFEALLFLNIAWICVSTPLNPLIPPQIPRPLPGHPIHLSTPPSPDCFTLTLAPPLKQNQCNDELEWFLEEERKYDVLDLVGANAPYTYSRPRTSEDHNGPCFVTIVADDLFDTDQFTFEDLAKFTVRILAACKDGRLRAGRGGILEMTDDKEDWGGFSLRVDARNPFPEKLLPGNETLLIKNGTFPLLPGRYLSSISGDLHSTSDSKV